VDRFGGNTLAAKKFVVEISFTRIMNAHFGEPLRLCGGMREPNFTGVTVAVKGSCFQRSRWKIAAENGDGVGLLQGIFFDKPVADAEHKHKCSG